MEKLRAIANKSLEARKEKPAVQSEITKPLEPEKKGFLKRGAKWLGRTIAEPYARLGTSVYNVGAATKDIARGNWAEASKELETSRKLPFLGEMKPAFTGREGIGEATGKMVGFGTEIGMDLLGGKIAGEVGQIGLKGLLRHAPKIAGKSAATGGLGTFGYQLQQKELYDKPISKAVIETGLMTGAGVGLGAITGGVLGTGAGFMGMGAKRIFSSAKKKLNSVLDEAINLGIKPTVKGKQTKIARDIAFEKRRNTFKIIKQMPPTLTDEAGNPEVRLPKNLEETLEGINQAKEKIFKMYDISQTIAGGRGAQANMQGTEKKLFSMSKDIKLSSEVRQYAQKQIGEIKQIYGAKPDVLQARIKDYNQSLKTIYKGDRVAIGKAKVDLEIAKEMRNVLDDMVNSITGVKYQGLKNAYGALLETEKEVAHRVGVMLKQNKRKLPDLADIFAGGELVHGILSANPIFVAKAASMYGIKSLYKHLNDPNRYIKRAFDLLGKLDIPESVSTKIPRKFGDKIPLLGKPKNIYAGPRTGGKSGLVKTQKTPSYMDIMKSQQSAGIYKKPVALLPEGSKMTREAQSAIPLPEKMPIPDTVPKHPFTPGKSGLIRQVNETKIKFTKPVNEITEYVSNAEQNVLSEIINAEKGYRYATGGQYGGDLGMKGVSSTFPKWVPDELRSRKLFDNVLGHINKNTEPTTDRVWRLYDLIKKRIDSEKKKAVRGFETKTKVYEETVKDLNLDIDDIPFF